MTATSTKPGPDQIQAHRGASAVAPENTIAAFRAAAEQGACWVELDVAFLGDDTLAVIHDPTLDRTTSRKGSLADITASDLPGIDAGAWFGEQFKNERLSTLDETLAALATLNLNVNVEIKQHAHHKSLSQLTKAVHASLERRDPKVGVMISSFDAKALGAMHALNPGYDLAMLWSSLPDNWQETLGAIPAKTIHLDYRHLSFAVLEATRKRDIQVRVWTCNRPELLTPFWGEGLGGVITDNPKLYLG